MNKEEEKKLLLHAYDQAKRLGFDEAQQDSWRSQVIRAIAIAQAKEEGSFGPHFQKFLDVYGDEATAVLAGIYSAGLLIGVQMGQTMIEQDVCIELASVN